MFKPGWFRSVFVEKEEDVPDLPVVPIINLPCRIPLHLLDAGKTGGILSPKLPRSWGIYAHMPNGAEASICFRIFFNSPLLVSKGIYHYRTFFFFLPGVSQPNGSTAVWAGWRRSCIFRAAPLRRRGFDSTGDQGAPNLCIYWAVRGHPVP